MTDEARFRAFYQQMYPRLWRYVHSLVSERSECDDLVQEAFFRFLRAAPPHLSDNDARSYLYRVATNLVKDRWRAQSHESLWLADGIEEDEIAAPQVDLGASLDVQRALALLSPGQRSLVWLAYVEGYEHKDIAAIVGVRSASVRVLLSRARRKLAELLSDPNSEGERS